MRFENSPYVTVPAFVEDELQPGILLSTANETDILDPQPFTAFRIHSFSEGIKQWRLHNHTHLHVIGLV